MGRFWYQWTAPADGEVTLDTIGSVDDTFFEPVDTVLGVYTGLPDVKASLSRWRRMTIIIRFGNLPPLVGKL